jgi:hypothetical protein
MRAILQRAARASLAALLPCALLLPSAAAAAHYPPEGPDANCSSCHTLDANEADANTSHISASSRTFPQIKAYDGLPSNQTPPHLGCTYCHYTHDNAVMRPVLGHFQGTLSFHPVGYAFGTARGDTNNEYLSGFGQVASPTPGELDCVDCHDIALGGGYPAHDAAPAGNPFMLRHLTAPGEYDGLCRTCHRSDAAVTVKGIEMRLTRHPDGAAGRPLVESDGTVLPTSDLDRDGVPDAAGIVDQCRACHDTHFSSKPRLFNDGHERHTVAGSEQTDTPVVGDQCTEICHYPGDSSDPAEGGSFGRHGHGKSLSTYKYKGAVPDADGSPVTMGMTCTSCHVSLDTASKPHVEPVPAGANERERYKSRFNLKFGLQGGDEGSVFGNPVWGICRQCHRSVSQHAPSAFSVGCLDCHDEHGEGAGAPPNVFMIPRASKREGSFLPLGTGAHTRTKAATETVVYDSPRYDLESAPYAAAVPDVDFFREDGAGVCDNAECHGAAGYAPFSDWLPSHGGEADADPGDDCSECHPHSGDAAGGWRATDH